jgi:hypothetical protein
MDFSRHSVLATRFATLALVFSVSACVLGHSLAEEQKMDSKPTPAQTTAKEEPKKEAKDAKQARPDSLKATNQKAVKVATAPKTEIKKKDVKPEEKPTPKQVAVARPADKRVVRYVSVETLNVRAHASMDAPVVGKLTLGTMYHVTVDGPWARISDNQYVMTRFLSSQPPHRRGSSWTMRK